MARRLVLWTCLLGGVIAAATWLWFGSEPAPSAKPTERVVVDFGHARTGAHSMSGLLHGLGATDPSGQWVTPLRPAIWRGDLSSASYSRAVFEGARYILVLSDLWGYPGRPGLARPAPYEDLAQWAAFVRKVAEENRGRSLVWEVWNEPDRGDFWAGSRDEYQETFLVAERTLREVLGQDVVVAGPGTSAYREDWLTALFGFCSRRGCRVDAVTWHELPDGTTSIADVATHIQQARTQLLANPLYRSVAARQILVSEYGGFHDRLYAGEELAYLYYLETGGADGAARACWPDRGGRETCGARTLGGLLDPATMRPRATWWALKAYADGVRGRVRSATSDPALVALASDRSPDRGHAQVLLGYFDPHVRPAPGRVDVVVTLRGLDRLAFLRGARRVRVTSRHLRGSSEAATLPASCGRPWIVTIHHGVARFTLHDVHLHDAMIVTLSASPAATGGGAPS